MDSLLRSTESDGTTEASVPQTPTPLRIRVFQACRKVLVFIIFGAFVVGLLGSMEAIYHFILIAVPLLFAIPPTCGRQGPKDPERCQDRCGLPLPEKFDEDFADNLFQKRRDGIVSVRNKTYSLPPVLRDERDYDTWERVLPGCGEVLRADIVNSISARDCSGSCRGTRIAVHPECILQGIASAPVKVCSKAYVSELVRQVPASSRIGAVVLYTSASVAGALLTAPNADSAGATGPHDWQEKLVKPPLPWRIFKSKMRAGDVAKLDISIRGASMIFDRMSDVWSIMIYLRAGQPVFAILATTSLCAGGDPLQIEGLQALQQSWYEGEPTLQLLQNSVHEGFFEGTIGVIIPIAAMSPFFGTPDMATVISLGISAATSLYSVFTAIQAMELLGALDVVKKANKRNPNYLDHLAMLKILGGRGLGSLQLFSVMCVVATSPCAFGFAFAMIIALLSLSNFLASGMEISRATIFPMAVSPYAMMTMNYENDAPQHGFLLFLYRIALLLAAGFLKGMVGFIMYTRDFRPQPETGIIYMIQGAAGCIALLLLLLSGASEWGCLCCCRCCCADPSLYFWSKSNAEKLTMELQNWDADEVLREDDDRGQYMPVGSGIQVTGPEGGGRNLEMGVKER